MTDILLVAGLVGAIGLVLGILLAIASKAFYVEVDDRLERLEDALPGINCGACGYPGCAGMAKGLLNGEVKPEACKPGTELTFANVRAILSEEDQKQVTA